jgi:repressor LexA
MAKLAEAINVRSSNISDWENGNSSPSTVNLLALSTFFNVTSDWLLTGKETNNINPLLSYGFKNLTEADKKDLDTFIEFLILRREKDDHEVTYKEQLNTVYKNNLSTTVREEPTVYLPILGDIARVPIEGIKAYQGNLPNSFIIRVRGNSMIDADIKDGDLVIFKAQPKVENGEIALVKVNDESTIKYFYLNNGECELRSANSAYPPEKYSIDEIDIIGKFVKVLEHK